MASWQLGPVLRGIRGHRAAAVLVVLQLAVGLAISVLAVLIGDYFISHRRKTAEVIADDLTIVTVQWPGRAADIAERRPAALATVTATPGVTSASVAVLPFGILERSPDDLRTTGAPVHVYEIGGGADFARTAGLQLRAGRDFERRDLGAPATAAIISTSLAARLWPQRVPIGAAFISRAHGAAVVVGVAEDLQTLLFGREAVDVIYALDPPHAPRMQLLVRGTGVRTALRDRLRGAGQAVTVVAADAEVRQFGKPVAAVLGLLGTMVGAIIIVIIVGSMGLTYFLVAARTREIGVRRAMGATRRDVIAHFLLENLILTAAGVLLGLGIMGIVLPVLFREQDDFAVNWPLVAGALATIVVLNVIATLIPARRAAAVPPVVASRTV